VHYFACFTHADDGITVTFPDIPEAITCGQTDRAAMIMAEDVLLSCVEIYFMKGWPFPLVREKKIGEKAVYLPEFVYAKILLHNTLLEKGVSKTQLAQLLDTTLSEVARIFELHHKTPSVLLNRALTLLDFPLPLFNLNNLKR
jgi:hicB family toxin-antitoxin system, antitoxin component